MAALTFRPWVRRGLAVALAASAVSAAHAASLGVSTDDLSAWTMAADIPTVNVCGTGNPDLPCVVPFGTVVKDVKNNAHVLILGTVEKKVRVDGGTVTVGSTGVVVGGIDQKGDGDVIVETGGQVYGKVVKERGDGSIVIDGTVADDVEENDAGDLTIGASGVVGGDVSESGSGSLSVAGAVVGDVDEEDDGDLVVVAGATIGGTVTEDDAGHLTINGPSTIGGSAIEKKDGDLTIGANVTVGQDADSRPGGVCVIDPAATILGTRKNLCAP